MCRLTFPIVEISDVLSSLYVLPSPLDVDVHIAIYCAIDVICACRYSRLTKESKAIVTVAAPASQSSRPQVLHLM